MLLTNPPTLFVVVVVEHESPLDRVSLGLGDGDGRGVGHRGDGGGGQHQGRHVHVAHQPSFSHCHFGPITFFKFCLSFNDFLIFFNFLLYMFIIENLNQVIIIVF